MQYTYLLIHGSWHDGRAWNDVAKILRNQCLDVHTPTIAGHGPHADYRASHADCVDSIVEICKTAQFKKSSCLRTQFWWNYCTTASRNRIIS